MTIKEALGFAKDELKKKKVEGPETSAYFLLRQVLKKDKSFLLAHPEKKLTIFDEQKFKRWVKRRAKHEPVWYITGEIEFYGQDFHVNKNVLIPRPETELMLERIFKMVDGMKGKKVLELGVGSGAIILTLANNLSHNSFFASDISPKALRVAKGNAKALNSDVKFKKGDLFGPWVGQKFDLVVVNLPYVPHEEMDTLAYDLIHYEPRVALDGGPLGLEVYQRFFEELPSFINIGAKVFCEIGDHQGPATLKMAKKAFPKAKVEIMSDYAEHDRVVIIET